MSTKNIDPNLVSVIVPFLNNSDWLLEALESVLHQTYGYWEIIVIDDGSELYHSNAAKKYCACHAPKMHYIAHAGHVNKGVTISRNVGIDVSRGNFIALLDADDKWLPEKLQVQMDLFKKLPAAGMICEASIFWFSWSNPSVKDAVTPVGTIPNVLYQPGILTKILYPLGEGAPPCPSGIMLTRKIFDQIGGFEPAYSGMYQLYEDQALLAKIYLHHPVYVSGIANNVYRKRNDSMSSLVSNPLIYYKVRTFFLDWLQEYLLSQQIADVEINNLIIAAKKNMDCTINPE